MKSLPFHALVLLCLHSAGCTIPDGKRPAGIDPGRRTVSPRDYIGKVEGRWLSGEEVKAVLHRWGPGIGLQEAYDSTFAEAYGVDLDRDGRDETVIRNCVTGLFAVIFGGEGGAGSIFSRRLQGLPAEAELVDLDRDGRIDFVNQGGRAWVVQVFRTTPGRMECVAEGLGGLDFNEERAVLDWYVPCGQSHGFYAGAEGCGGIQRQVPFRFFWDSDDQGFHLVSRTESDLADCLWHCFRTRPGEVPQNRYLDWWNWGVCLLAAALEFDRAMDLARLVPESPGGEEGKTMASREKRELIARVQELAREYTPWMKLPAPGPPPPWLPPK